jgi:hypothetical protein
MRRALQFGLLLLALAPWCAAQKLVDRIIATVNGQPILLSDWEVEMRFEAMLDRKPLPLSDDDARGALNRLIDQQLLRQQFRTYRLATPSAGEVASRVDDLRKQLGATETRNFDALLARYGLGEKEFQERVTNQAEMLEFIDARLRPSVHVDRRSVEAYYKETLTPELQRKGEKPEPLEQVSAQIEELLAQQRVAALTSDWLKDLRQQSKIQVDPALALDVKPPEAGAP